MRTSSPAPARCAKRSRGPGERAAVHGAAARERCRDRPRLRHPRSFSGTSARLSVAAAVVPSRRGGPAASVRSACGAVGGARRRCLGQHEPHAMDPRRLPRPSASATCWGGRSRCYRCEQHANPRGARPLRGFEFEDERAGRTSALLRTQLPRNVSARGTRALPHRRRASGAGIDEVFSGTHVGLGEGDAARARRRSSSPAAVAALSIR
jgi:hypothetical protein